MRQQQAMALVAERDQREAQQRRAPRSKRRARSSAASASPRLVVRRVAQIDLAPRHVDAAAGAHDVAVGALAEEPRAAGVALEQRVHGGAQRCGVERPARSMRGWTG